MILKESVLKYRNAQTTIGLLGGSFNPAHAGHFHISILSKKKLDLKAIWWLVAKQNPLKSTKIMRPYEERTASALKFKTPYLKITNFEQKFNLSYTVDVMRRLQRIFPYIKFVWIMGADNLVSLHKWYKWQELFKLMPILIFDRNTDAYRALSSKAATYFKHSRAVELHSLALLKPPAWGMLRLKKHPLSSTFIREANNKLASY